MKTIAFHNLGCKVNSYELDAMLQNTQKEGYQIVDFTQKADIYIVNTCTVTNIADRKSRQMLHRAKQLNPEAIVVAVGCYVQNGLQNPETDPAVDLCVGNNRKKELFRIINDFYNEKKIVDAVPDIASESEYEELSISETAEHTRAYIKIEDGCNQFCTYCAIPNARGRVRSRRQDSIIGEVKALADNGYKEVVLTGIHISSYGLDFLGIKSSNYEDAAKAGLLLELIRNIAAIEGIERIRLGSLEPRIITEDFVKGLSEIPQVCPHFHLSLQSGCDETLKRMNRHYSAQQFLDGTNILRKYYERVAITTDVIVGFPGETEEEFEKSYDFIEKIRFYELHVFRYSRRKGTVADTMKNQVPEEIKAKRSDALLELDERMSDEYRQEYIGCEMELLAEEIQEIDGIRYLVGHTKDYVLGAIPVSEFTSEKEAEETAGKLVKGTASRTLTKAVLVENVSVLR
ncbi:MAG: tRNA (N(6)-L-threonylcarbamoyladenosine(37)-C(2))-methylthiotransferase MtaB [Lachnospiraceae bacterium]|nr:tRNA (N(6)-L-threonylcarbamoyladenosine(37)-C(2))-methylthiotransferase MtaB [Candidatus Merdinaster equi]